MFLSGDSGICECDSHRTSRFARPVWLLSSVASRADLFPPFPFICRFISAARKRSHT